MDDDFVSAPNQAPVAADEDRFPVGQWGDFLRVHLSGLVAELGEEDVGTEDGDTAPTEVICPIDDLNWEDTTGEDPTATHSAGPSI